MERSFAVLHKERTILSNLVGLQINLLLGIMPIPIRKFLNREEEPHNNEKGKISHDYASQRNKEGKGNQYHRRGPGSRLITHRLWAGARRN